MAASRAAPHLPLSTGSKNAGPRGIVPCGMSATSSPASSAFGRLAQRLVRARSPARRGCRRAPRSACPTTGTSNTSFFPRKRTGRPRLGERHADRERVEVAAVVADDDRGPVLGDVVGAGDVEPRVGDEQRVRQRPSSPAAARPRARERCGTPRARRGAGSASDAATAIAASAGVGVAPRTGCPTRRAAACRSSCRSRRSSTRGRRRARPPTPAPRRACPVPTRTRRRSCRRSGRRSRRSGSRRRRRSRAPRRAAG